MKRSRSLTHTSWKLGLALCSMLLLMGASPPLLWLPPSGMLQASTPTTFANPNVVVGQSTNFASGSLIIPMDTTYQDKGMIEAYGLLYHLLKADIPVHWVIKKGKKLGDADFTVAAKDVETGAAIASHGYRGGPFVVEASEATKALTLIKAWQAKGSDVAVHQASAAFQGRTGRYLTAAPSIAVIADKNEKIAFKYLNAAKIPDRLGNPWPLKGAATYPAYPDVLTISQVAGPTTTSHKDGALFRKSGVPNFCQVMTMHWGVKEVVPEVVAEYREFLKYPTHVFAHCQGVNAVENNNFGRFLTPNGFVIDNNLSGTLSFLNLDTPFAQMDGPFEVVGGSEKAYSLPPGDTYLTRNVVMITDTVGGPGTRDVWMTGYLDGKCTIDEDDLGCNAGVGKVSYLGGHEYEIDMPMSKNPKSQGTRLFLNSLFEASCATDEGQARLHLIKQGPTHTTQDTVTYTLYYSNLGNAPALDVKLTDTLPANSTFVSATNGGKLAGNVVTWDVGDLAAAQSGAVQVTLRLGAYGKYQNQFQSTYKVGVNTRTATSNIATTEYAQTGPGEVIPDGGSPDSGAPPDTGNPPDGNPNPASCGAPNMLIVLDRSGSMQFSSHPLCPQGDCSVRTPKTCAKDSDCSPMPRTTQPAPGTTPKYLASCKTGQCQYTRWDIAQNALKEVAFKYSGTAPNYTDRKLQFGLITFNNLATVDAGIAASPTQVQAALNNASAGGGTVYTSALLAAQQHLVTSLSNDSIADRTSFLLLMTDGKPSEPCANSVQIARDMFQGTGAYRIQTPNGSIHRVKTYVIGFGSSLDSTATDCLNQLAAVGGTQRCNPNTPGCTAFYFADNEAQLKQALDAITTSGSLELCDNKDNDCDGQVDEGLTQPCYSGPANTEGKGPCKGGTQTCQAGQWGACAGEVIPTTEICDGKDNNCNGSVDEGVTRTCKTACGTGTEACTNGAWGTCTAPQPQPEICDNIDNNCDGAIDEGCKCKEGDARSCYTGPANTRNVGACSDGLQRCIGGTWEAGCKGETQPATETCNGFDDNCDGKVDEGCQPNCKDGETRPCPGACGTGTQTCQQAQWGPCTGVTKAAIEICDGKDNDCDGKIDEGMIRACKTACGDGIDICTRGQWSGCQGRQPQAEVCDGFDNNCDGKVDEQVTCPNGASCVEGACLRPCRALECPTGQTCQSDDFCHPNTSCSTAKCTAGQVCQAGKCVNTCDLLECPSGFVCWLGKCTPPDCYSFGCPTGKACRNGICVDNPCANTNCPTGEYCKDGKCIRSCQQVTCPAKQSCEDGRCKDDPCAGVTCQSDQICYGGTCVADPCKSIECPTGRICYLGECQDDPCTTISCEAGLSCQKGRCVDLCDKKTCDAGLACFQGNCVPDDCYNRGCTTGKICQKDQCVDDLCATKSCAAGTACRAGTCVASCHTVQCKSSERCRDGSCEPNPCDQISCPTGQICEGGQCTKDVCQGVTCPKGRICEASTGQCVDDPCLAMRCPIGSVCHAGQCIDACSQNQCPKDFNCELGVCVAKDCYSRGCPDQKICAKGQCIDDPCTGKQCPDGFCRQGDCVKSCAGIACDAGKRCVDGTCVDDPCAGKTCPDGEFCDKGNCKANPCQKVYCGIGRECDPLTGTCIDDPCLNTQCPANQSCYQGQCIGQKDDPRNTEQTPGEGTLTETPLPPLNKEQGGGQDGSTSENTPPQATGCQCSPSSTPSSWFLSMLLLLLCLQIAAQRRPQPSHIDNKSNPNE